MKNRSEQGAFLSPTASTDTTRDNRHDAKAHKRRQTGKAAHRKGGEKTDKGRARTKKRCNRAHDDISAARTGATQQKRTRTAHARTYIHNEEPRRKEREAAAETERQRQTGRAPG